MDATMLAFVCLIILADLFLLVYFRNDIVFISQSTALKDLDQTWRNLEIMKKRLIHMNEHFENRIIIFCLLEEIYERDSIVYEETYGDGVYETIPGEATAQPTDGTQTIEQALAQITAAGEALRRASAQANAENPPMAQDKAANEDVSQAIAQATAHVSAAKRAIAQATARATGNAYPSSPDSSFSNPGPLVIQVQAEVHTQAEEVIMALPNYQSEENPYINKDAKPRDGDDDATSSIEIASAGRGDKNEREYLALF